MIYYIKATEQQHKAATHTHTPIHAMQLQRCNCGNVLAEALHREHSTEMMAKQHAFVYLFSRKGGSPTWLFPFGFPGNYVNKGAQNILLADVFCHWDEALTHRS